MKTFTLACFSLLLVLGVKAQRDEAAACNNVQKLKNGTLLIRLYEGINKYEALKKKKLILKADEFKKQRYVENLRIVNALKKKYKFSKVAYFYGTDTEKVLKGELDGVLLNDSLRRGGVMFSGGFFMIAEMGDIDAEAFGSSVQGFAIFTDKMKKPAKPFPHFVSRRGIIMIKRSDFELADTMQYKLEKAWKACGSN